MAGEQRRPRRKTPADPAGNASSEPNGPSRAARSDTVPKGSLAKGSLAKGSASKGAASKDTAAAGFTQGSSEVVTRLEAAVAAVTSERDRLTGELAAAQARIGDLEARNTQALERINWVIESLQTALDD